MDTDLRRLLVSEGRKKKRHAYRISGPTCARSWVVFGLPRSGAAAATMSNRSGGVRAAVR